MEALKFFADAWHYFAAFFTILIAVIASGHAVMYKRDSRAAVLWVGVIWLTPLIGALLYMLLGINRIRRLAVSLRRDVTRYTAELSVEPSKPSDLREILPPEVEQLSRLAAVLDRVTSRPLTPGARIIPLLNGDQAFPAMLEAIDGAAESISLATYIFDNDNIGKQFADRLGAAVERGVEVRVLIDDTGARYSWPSIIGRLKSQDVKVCRFLPMFATWRPMTINLRNHRKIMVVDGKAGFAGGMNIRDGNLLLENPGSPVQDLQFKIEGPVVAQLQESFADDWYFCSKELLRGPAWFPKLEAAGDAVARGISDGPDEDFDKLRWTILSALNCAQRKVTIMTPYFLPDQSIISTLNVTAMRGVDVDIILPEKSNLPFVHWATFAILWQVLSRGCRVWLTPPPFDHSKVMIVDGFWTMIGSANWDTRSLRLNFEFNVEAYSQEFAAQCSDIVASKLRGAREITLEEVDSRSVPVKLRDGIMRLATPYL